MHINRFLPVIAAAVVSISLLSCGDDKEKEPEQPDGAESVTNWSAVSGRYLTKPSVSQYSYGIRYMEAKGLQVKKNIVFYYPSVSNSKYIEPDIPEIFPGFSGGESSWKNEVGDWYSFGVSLSAGRLLVMDDNWNPSGDYMLISREGIEYNGEMYYRPDVFNANIDRWAAQ